MRTAVQPRRVLPNVLHIASVCAWAALRVAVLFVLGCIVREVASLDTLLGNASQIVASHLVTPHYLARRDAIWPPDDQQGNRHGQPLVLLLDDEDLRFFGYPYPPPMALHADVLQVAADAGAQSVFIDFSFKDDRGAPDRAALLQQIDALAALPASAPMPVYLAVFNPPSKEPGALPPEEPPCWGLLPDLAQRIAGFDAQCPAPPGAPGAAPNGQPPQRLLTPVNVGLDRARPDGIVPYRKHGADCRSEACGRHPFSPAYALAGGDRNPSRPPSTMEIVWAARVNTDDSRFAACQPQPLSALLTKGLGAAQQPCPMLDVISVSRLLRMNEPERTKHLAGRAIFYGGNLELSSDRHAVALYGELPGVFVHATAYDNLRVYGENVKREGLTVAWLEAWFPSRDGLLFDVVLLACALALVAVPLLARIPLPAAWRPLARRRAAAWRPLRAELAWLARWRWYPLPVLALLLPLLLFIWPSAQAGVLVAAACYLLVRATFSARAFAALLLSAALGFFAYHCLHVGPLYLFIWAAMFGLACALDAMLDGWYRHLQHRRQQLPATAPAAERLIVGAAHALLCGLTSTRRATR